MKSTHHYRLGSPSPLIYSCHLEGFIADSSSSVRLGGSLTFQQEKSQRRFRENMRKDVRRQMGSEKCALNELEQQSGSRYGSG